MRLNIRHANHTEVGNDKEEKEDGGDNAKWVMESLSIS